MAKRKLTPRTWGGKKNAAHIDSVGKRVKVKAA